VPERKPAENAAHRENSHLWMENNYMSDLKNCSGSIIEPGSLVYSVGTDPSLKHSKMVFLDSGMGKRPVSASILEKTTPSGT